MKVLLDTHTFIWWDSAPNKLSPQASAHCQNPANTILLSVVSVWEMIIKLQMGKLTVGGPLANLVRHHQQVNGLQILPVTLDHVLQIENLPALHKDPFDRLLIAQAKEEGAVLLSADALLAQYPVQVVW